MGRNRHQLVKISHTNLQSISHSLSIYLSTSQGLNVEIESISHSSNRIVLTSLDEMIGVEESMLGVNLTLTMTRTRTKQQNAKGPWLPPVA